MSNDLEKLTTLNKLSDELFQLVANEELTDEDLREASEGLLPALSDALKDAGFGAVEK